MIESMLDRMLRVTPNASQTRSKAPGRVGPRDLSPEFPLFAQRGRGPYLTCGGRRYLDFVGANAAVPLGYSRREVREAVKAAAHEGPLLSLPSSLEAEVAERLIAIVPCAEQVRFVKTGSEACTGVVMIAREYFQPRGTGGPPRRQNVYVGSWAYHGWHAWAQEGGQEHRVFTYPPNSPQLLERIAGDPEAALVFYEPPRFGHTADIAWLRVVREACTKHRVLLAFDEMVMGFRLARAGGQEYYGVTPDLATYGKALANGYSLAAICGRRDVMTCATRVVSGTYGGDRIGLAAAREVLDIYAREPVIETLWRNGRAFFDAYAKALMFGGGVPLVGHPVHFRIEWQTAEQADRVLLRCAEQGVLFHRDANNASAAMTEAQARHGADVLALAVKEVG